MRINQLPIMCTQFSKKICFSKEAEVKRSESTNSSNLKKGECGDFSDSAQKLEDLVLEDGKDDYVLFGVANEDESSKPILRGSVSPRKPFQKQPQILSGYAEYSQRIREVI